MNISEDKSKVGTIQTGRHEVSRRQQQGRLCLSTRLWPSWQEWGLLNKPHSWLLTWWSNYWNNESQEIGLPNPRNLMLKGRKRYLEPAREGTTCLINFRGSGAGHDGSVRGGATPWQGLRSWRIQSLYLNLSLRSGCLLLGPVWLYWLQILFSVLHCYCLFDWLLKTGLLEPRLWLWQLWLQKQTHALVPKADIVITTISMSPFSTWLASPGITWQAPTDTRLSHSL